MPDQPLLNPIVVTKAVVVWKNMPTIASQAHVCGAFFLFVWQTSEDKMVASYETTELVAELQRSGVPVEYCLFERGSHRCCLRPCLVSTSSRG